MANNAEGRPYLGIPDPRTHLPGGAWPPGRREGPSGPGLCSGRPLHCAAGPGSAAGTHWQTPWLCGGAGGCGGERLMLARSGPGASLQKGASGTPTCAGQVCRKESARNRAERRKPARCAGAFMCVHAFVHVCRSVYFNYKRRGFGAARQAAVSGRNQGVDVPVETGGHLPRQPR